MAISSAVKRGKDKLPANIALDGKKQKEFNQKVTSIGKKARVRTSNRKVIGQRCVKITNLPWGFFENELTEYFTQFGGVQKVKVMRSTKTLKGTGVAFVLFKDEDAAEVVADTMNNYLMFDKLLKCKLLKTFPVEVFKSFKLPHISMKERAIIRTNMASRIPETRRLELFLKSFKITQNSLAEKGIVYTLENLGDLEEQLPARVKPVKTVGETVKEKSGDAKSNKTKKKTLRNFKRKERRQQMTKEVGIRRKKLASPAVKAEGDGAFVSVDGSDEEITFKTPVKGSLDKSQNKRGLRSVNSNKKRQSIEAGLDENVNTSNLSNVLTPGSSVMKKARKSQIKSSTETPPPQSGEIKRKGTLSSSKKNMKREILTPSSAKKVLKTPTKLRSASLKTSEG